MALADIRGGWGATCPVQDCQLGGEEELLVVDVYKRQVGGYEHGPAAPRRAYHLNETRRHAFPADTIAVDPEANLRGPWGAGGRFVIRPVSAERRAELDAWDTFCYVHLEDHELKALEELREDSWLGGEWE